MRALGGWLGGLLVLSLCLLPGPAGDARAVKDVAAADSPPRVLVYSGTIGFRHASIPVGNAVLKDLAAKTGRFTIVEVIEDPAALTAQRLGQVDAVLWNSTTGAESPFGDEQQAAYERFVGCGGGHLGVHASTDSYKDWPAWKELTGAFFKSHPAARPTSDPERDGEGQPEAEIIVSDQQTPITAPWRGQESFLLRDEFYALDGDPSKVIADFKAVLSFGGFTEPHYVAFNGNDYAPNQPLAWTGSFRGRNRLAYTNLGHSISTWRREDFQRSLTEAIVWVGGRRPDRDCLVPVSTRRGTKRADRLRGTGGRDRLVGLAGDDELRGLAGDDRLLGGGGADRLVGGPGTDALLGGSGNDRLDARDGDRDTVDCGAGRRDRARADRIDSVRRCER